MEKESAVRSLIERMKKIGEQARLSEEGWQTKGETAALMILAVQGGSALPSEMAQASHVSTARIAVLLRQMESKGLIHRYTDEQDRRKVRVTLTEEGHRQAQRQMDVCRSKWGQLVEFLGDEDTEALIRILERIGAFMEEDNAICTAKDQDRGTLCQN